MAKPTIADRLNGTPAEFDATQKQLAELEGKRNGALLVHDDRAAAKLATQIDDLRALARGHQDKIALLEAEAAPLRSGKV